MPVASFDWLGDRDSNPNCLIQSYRVSASQLA